MATIGSIVLKITADTASFGVGLKKAESSLNSFGDKMQSAKAMVGGFVAAVASAAAVDMFKTWVSEGLDFVDNLNDVSDKIGISTEALTGLGYAAQLAGSSQDQLNAALTKMEIGLGKATSGLNPAAQALEALGMSSEDADAVGNVEKVLEKLGLSAKALKAESPDQAFLKIAESISKLPTQADKASAAVALFGKAGVQLVPLLDQGAAGIQRFQAEAERLGITFNKVDAEKVAAAKDALDKVDMTIQGMKNRLAIELAPAIESIVNQFIDAGKTSVDTLGNTNAGLGALVESCIIAADTVAMLGLAWNWVDVKIAQFGALLNSLDKYVVKAEAVEKAESKAAQSAEAANKKREAFEKRLAEQSPGEKIRANYNKVRSDAEASSAARKSKDDSGGVDTEALTAQAKAATAATDYIAKLQQEVAMLNNVGLSADMYKAKIAGVSDEIQSQIQALEAQKKALEDQKKVQDSLAKMRDDLDTFNMSAGDKAAHDIGKQGGNSQQQADAKRYADQLEKMKEQKKLQDDLAESAKKYTEDAMSPLEKYRAELEKINQLKEMGLITDKTATESKKKIGLEYLSTQGSNEYHGVSALSAGSKEARSAILAHQQGGMNKSPLDKIQDLEQKALDDQVQQTQYTRRIWEKTVTPVIVSLNNIA